MCRLFISLNLKNSIDELNKYYNHRETKQMVHGFGIGKYTHNKWNFDKDINPLYKSPLYNEFVDKNNSGIIVAHARQIYVKELSNDELDKYYTIHNIHPFQYKDFWMAHHGNLFLEKNNHNYRFQTNMNSLDFTIKINDIYSKFIDKSFNIKGNTDSELMFYLFMSLYKENAKHRKFTERSNIIHSFIEMVEIIKKYGFINMSNIIIANGKYIIISNIHIPSSYQPNIEPIYLYKKSLTFCSSKLDTTYKKIPINTYFVYNIITGNIKSYSM